MKPRTIALVVLVASVVSALAGYWFGVYQGLPLGLSADFLPRGVVASQQIALLRAGRTDDVITGLESDIDNGLIWGYDVLHHPMRRLWGPLWGFEVYPNYEQYAARLADYRLKHPSPFKADAFDKVPPGKEGFADFYKELADGTRANKRKMDDMIQRYATKQ